MAATSIGLWHGPPAWAAPGDLDPSFSGDGQAFVDVAAGPDYGMAMARQPDGRILLAGRTGLSDHGNFGVARLKVNGHLDPAFGGGDGRVTTDFGGDDWAHAVAVQSDGKILVAGSRGNAPARMAVARYLPGGALDTSFSGDGKRIVPVGSSLGATDVAVRPSGAIVLVGDAPGKMSVVQLRPNGTLDPGFGQGGVRLIGPAGSTVDTANGVTIDGTGRVVVVGSVGGPCATNLLAARVRQDGSLDQTFSGDGRWTLNRGKNDSGLGVVLDQQGRVVIGGYSGSCPDADGERMLVVRLTPHGVPDPAFSGDGVVLTDFGPAGDEASGIAVRSGRIVAAGLTGLSSSSGTDTRIAVARYRPGGALDDAFGGGDGKVALDPSSDLDVADDVAVQADGTIVLGGGVSAPARFYAARLLG
jgi:uncharacterized delta-60 repeat protein